jgi:O-antigen/teichoic acid export membrane protein
MAADPAAPTEHPAEFAPRRFRSVVSQTFAFGGLGLIGNLLSGIVVARALGADGRGFLTAVIAAPNLALWFFGLGAAKTLSYFIARSSRDAARLASTWLLLTTGAGLLALGILQLTLGAQLQAQSDYAVSIARLWSLTIFLAVYGEVFKGVLLGLHRYTLFNRVSAVPALTIALGYLGLWASGLMTPESALVVTLVGNGAPVVVCGWVVLRDVGLRRPSGRLLRETVPYGLKVQAAGISGTVNARFDTLILPAFIGAAGVGLYSVATNVSWIVVALASALQAVLVPAVAAKRREDGLRTIVKAVQATLVVGGMLAVVGVLLANIGLALIYGREFDAAATALRILLPGSVAYAAGAVLASGIEAAGRPGLAALTQVPSTVVTVVGLFLLVKPLGIEGAALVSSCAYVLQSVIALVLLKRVYGASWSAFRMSRGDVAASAAAVRSRITRRWSS